MKKEPEFERLLDLSKTSLSAFVFGPRQTGKTSLLRALNWKHYYDLLDPVLEQELKTFPEKFHEEISALPEKSKIIVDEVQRVPQLLDYIQKAMGEKKHRFILSGSSSRKLKRGAANLLGGRAADFKLHPLTQTEVGESFSIQSALHYGTLPKIATLWIEHQLDDLKLLLKSYITTYLKEEIQAEALVRNIGNFNRFLHIAAAQNAEITEFSNISREASVPASTVKEFYQILEDTLLGNFLWQWDSAERKKARPKFYFFDCGVLRALQNRLNDPPTSAEMGQLFETWFVREILRLRDYGQKEHTFSYWRSGNSEIDLIISGSRGPLLAFEIKSNTKHINTEPIAAFRKKFTKTPVYIVSMNDEKPRTISAQDQKVDVLPWKKAVELYTAI